MSLKII